MRAHSSLRLGTLHGTTPELLASPWYCAWGFCMVWEAGLPHKTSSAPPQRRNGRACSSLTARGGGLPVGVSEMQRKLSQWATADPTKRFVDLYSLLCNDVWLRVAHHKVNSNRGRETAGIDWQSMSHFNGDLDGNLERLRVMLKAKTFEPIPVRRVYIPKSHGKKRPIGIPGIRDRIVQEALRMILEPIWEADFSTHSYGFRPNRSTYDALSYIGKRL